jgi:hypothetical protein
MSIPACWDTLRAETNEGYFDFQQIACFAHDDSGYKPASEGEASIATNALLI